MKVHLGGPRRLLTEGDPRDVLLPTKRIWTAGVPFLAAAGRDWRSFFSSGGSNVGHPKAKPAGPIRVPLYAYFNTPYPGLLLPFSSSTFTSMTLRNSLRTVRDCIMKILGFPACYPKMLQRNQTLWYPLPDRHSMILQSNVREQNILFKVVEG